MTVLDAARLEARVAEGGRLSDEEIEILAGAGDLLSLGILADAARQRRHGRRTTFVRVAAQTLEEAQQTPPGAPAREWRVTGWPGLERAPDRAAALAGAAVIPVTAFSLADVEEAAAAAGRRLRDVLEELAAAGLRWLSEAPADRMRHLAAGLTAAGEAGLRVARLTVTDLPASPLRFLREIRAALEAGGPVGAFAPLPARTGTEAPTTGYDDVKLVALSRLVVDNIGSVQVDWSRYGPKLAQVALTFGVDDIDGVSSGETAGPGPRRGPLEEIRQNIQAAGQVPVERDGWFHVE